MPRKAEPSFELKRVVWDMAAKGYKDKYSAIQRHLDRVLPEQGLDEDTPDIRTIKRIIDEDINELSREVVVSELPNYVWSLRNDYESIKNLAEGRAQASVSEIEPLITKARQQHLDEIRSLIEKWYEAVQEYTGILQMDEISVGPHPHTIPSQLAMVVLDPLFKSLKQHLPFKDLWQSHSEMCDKFTHYWYTYHGIKNDIIKHGRMWSNVEIRNLNFAKPIIYQISRESVGWEPYDLNFRCRGGSLYVDGTTPEDPNDTFHFLILLGDHPEDYIETYKSLVNNILQSNEVDNLVRFEQELFDSKLRIEWQLEEILLSRDYVNCTCRFCPGQPKALR